MGPRRYPNSGQAGSQIILPSLALPLVTTVVIKNTMTETKMYMNTLDPES